MLLTHKPLPLKSSAFTIFSVLRFGLIDFSPFLGTITSTATFAFLHLLGWLLTLLINQMMIKSVEPEKKQRNNCRSHFFSRSSRPLLFDANEAECAGFIMRNRAEKRESAVKVLISNQWVTLWRHTINNFLFRSRIIINCLLMANKYK